MNQTEQYGRIEELVYSISMQTDGIQENLKVLRDLSFITNCGCPSHIERDLHKILDLLKDVNNTIDTLQILSR